MEIKTSLLITVHYENCSKNLTVFYLTQRPRLTSAPLNQHHLFRIHLCTNTGNRDIVNTSVIPNLLCPIFQKGCHLKLCHTFLGQGKYFSTSRPSSDWETQSCLIPGEATAADKPPFQLISLANKVEYNISNLYKPRTFFNARTEIPYCTSQWICPLSILWETLSPRKAEGAPAPVPRGSLSTGLRNRHSSEPRLQKIKGSKGETSGKANSKCWSTVKTSQSHRKLIFTHKRNGQEVFSP